MVELLEKMEVEENERDCQGRRVERRVFGVEKDDGWMRWWWWWTFQRR